ncbi:MAG: DUF4129 domain-containing protein [Anaerolineae bacterium]
MRIDARTWGLLLLGTAITAIALLGMSLSSLELRPGEPLILPEQMRRMERGRGEIPPMPGGDVIYVMLRVTFILTIALLPFAIIYCIISPKARKRVLASVITLLAICSLLMLLRPSLNDIEEEIQLPDEAPERMPEGALSAPGAEFTADPSPGLILAVNIALALLLAAAIVIVIWFIWQYTYPSRSTRTAEETSPLKHLAQEAQETIQAVRAGADLNDVVTRCYVEMIQILREQRGIHRQHAMTPREFEIHLKEMGLPAEQTRRLTRLFERVRYGDKRPSKQQEDEAIASLNAIVEFCGKSS